MFSPGVCPGCALDSGWAQMVRLCGDEETRGEEKEGDCRLNPRKIGHMCVFSLLLQADRRTG